MDRFKYAGFEHSKGAIRTVMGDLVFKDIGTNEAKHFKSLLMKIPSNAKKLHNIDSFKGIDLDKLKGKLRP